ncbi:MAG: 4a-hydroxytetrahydrobiopterin dehydratase [Ancylomarina sp.]|jgi:4a-hydroxytetrahydrobiopterin dehydratase
MDNLSKKKCAPCRVGIQKLTGDEAKVFLADLNDWLLVEDHHIKKTFKFPDFKYALQFVNQVGEIAEEENHHPNINFTWGKVEISIWTHEIDGLHENDFILAAKIDEIL